MDEFCVLERFEKLRNEAARNRTSIEELGMKLKDPFVKVKDMTGPRDSRAIARGAVRMATWPEIAGRKQPPKQPPSLKVAKVRSPGTPPNGLSEETHEEVKTKEEMSSSPSSSTPPTADFTAQNCLRPIGRRWIHTNKGDTKNVAMFRHGDDFVVCGTRTQHAELLVHQLGLNRSSKAVPTPAERSKPSVDFGTPLGRDEHILYRQATVRRPLLAVKPMTAQGQWVCFGPDRAFAYKIETGNVMPFESIPTGWNLTMELEAPENANKKLQEATETKIAKMKTRSQNPTMHFAASNRVKDSIRMVALTQVEEKKDDVIDRDTSQTMSKSITDEHVDETSLPFNVQDFNVKDVKVRIDEKQNDLESYTFNVKECNAMIIEINDKKSYIIFVQFKQQQKEMDRNTMETIIMRTDQSKPAQW